ncbi:MAG: hypothetical protein KDK39_14000 [Leptospiraceae bacterium]|nr:hypothetical protein [Leptospiraceae bacterium]
MPQPTKRARLLCIINPKLTRRSGIVLLLCLLRAVGLAAEQNTTVDARQIWQKTRAECTLDVKAALRGRLSWSSSARIYEQDLYLRRVGQEQRLTISTQDLTADFVWHLPLERLSNQIPVREQLKSKPETRRAFWPITEWNAAVQTGFILPGLWWPHCEVTSGSAAGADNPSVSGKALWLQVTCAGLEPVETMLLEYQDPGAICPRGIRLYDPGRRLLARAIWQSEHATLSSMGRLEWLFTARPWHLFVDWY